MTLSLVTEGVSLVLRGDADTVGSPAHLSWLVLNRKKGEYLDPATTGGSSSSLPPFYNISLSHFILRHGGSGEWQKAQEPLSADWADNAEICFFTSESVGRIEVPYEIPSVDLKH